VLTDRVHGVDELVSRTFVGDVLWYIGGAALVGGAGLAVNGAIATLASPAAVGVFNQSFALYVIAGQIAVGGLQFSTLRGVSQQERLEDVGPVVVSALFLVVISAGAAAGSLFLLRDAIGRALDSEDTAAGIVYMLPALVLFPINKVMVMALNGLSRMRMVAAFQGLRPLIILISLAFLLVGHAPTPMLSGALSSAEAVVFAGLAVTLSRRISWRALDRRVLPDWVKSHISFALRGALSGIAVEVNTRIDVLILGFFRADAVVGIYSTAAVVAEAFTLAPAALRANLDPMLGACFASGDTERISAVAERLRPVMRKLTAAAAVAALLAFPAALWFLQGAIPVGSTTQILAIMLIGVSLSVLYRPFLGLLLQGGRPGAYTVLSAAVLAVNSALCFTLVPALGVYGAAVAVSAAYAAEALLVVLTARVMLGVRL
jgi:O-antigen/teichoic acid export membrane protein